MAVENKKQKSEKQKSEKNGELMKTYKRIRSYMRRFYVYGFESRKAMSENMQQSTRAYDNEHRRINNWLGEYMQFQWEQGKINYITLDASRLSRNPLYKSWKAKSFTKNDIMLHFYILDILKRKKELTKKNIADLANDDYFYIIFGEEDDGTIDECIIELKLNEYVKLGLIEKHKKGKTAYYRLIHDKLPLPKWQAACAFYSETAPLGEVGSYTLDRLPEYNYFGFKHHFFLYTLDSGILFELVTAMSKKCNVIVVPYYAGSDGTVKSEYFCCPLRIYCSTQTGRRYLLCYEYGQKELRMFRLDRIKSVTLKKACSEKLYAEYLALAKASAPHIWGVALLGNRQLEHLEFTVYVGEQEGFILDRLQREKRSGVLTQVDAEHYRFSIDVYDARELLPWLRSFITRITSLECSNAAVRQTFMQDVQELTAYYSEV